MTIRYVNWNNDVYTFVVYAGRNDVMTIGKNGEQKTVKIKDDPSWFYKLQKTQIAVRGGAEGLYKNIQSLIDEYFGTVWIEQIGDYAVKNMKPAKL